MMEAPEKSHATVLQPSLFDSVELAVALTPTHKAELAAAIEMLLREIAAALADTTVREGGHE
jgi:hypothetical protein